MKTNKPLQKKTSLKAKTTLKRGKPLAKTSSAKISKLTKKADAIFSHYIRLRDASYDGEHLRWVAPCISCGKEYVVRYCDDGRWRWGRQEEAGHYVGRGHYGLRYDEFNVNDQCTRCNKWLSGNNAKYAIALDEKYGKGTHQELIERSKEKFSRTIPFLEQVIHDYTICLEDYLLDEH